MDIFLVTLLFVGIILFWGMLRNLRIAGEIATLGSVAAASKFTATTAKVLTDEDMVILAKLREAAKQAA